MPVDVGLQQATKPQDMAVERWLNFACYGSESVVDLAIGFEPLPVDMSKESDENANYTLVREAQVRVST